MSKRKNNKDSIIIFFIIVSIILGVLLLIMIGIKESRNKKERTSTTTSSTSSISTITTPTTTKKIYDGQSYPFTVLRNNKTSTISFINEVNKLIESKDLKLKYKNKTTERGYVFYQFVSKSDLTVDVIYKKSSGKFHALNILGSKRYLDMDEVRKAIMTVSALYDVCFEDTYCSRVLGILDAKVNFEIYNIETYKFLDEYQFFILNTYE